MYKNYTRNFHLQKTHKKANMVYIFGSKVSSPTNATTTTTTASYITWIFRSDTSSTEIGLQGRVTSLSISPGVYIFYNNSMGFNSCSFANDVKCFRSCMYIRAFQWPVLLTYIIFILPILSLDYLSLQQYLWITILTVFILTHPVNFPCGRKLERPEKTHDFRQVVDRLFSHESIARLEPTISEVKGACSDDCATVAHALLVFANKYKVDTYIKQFLQLLKCSLLHLTSMWRTFLTY
jgi:hypothetical protein